jgi:uncharacterized protein (DUF3820 family)
MVLEFGKYAGRSISDVPEQYLRWLLEHNGKIVAAVKAELEFRETESLANLSMEERIVEAGFRALALKCHPDRDGGSHEEMLELNATTEKLRRRARSEREACTIHAGGTNARRNY